MSQKKAKRNRERPRARPLYSEQQWTAYHEAAHAVAALRLGICLEAVRLAKDGQEHVVLSNGELRPNVLGSMELCDSAYNMLGEKDAENYFTMQLAGICSQKITQPRRSYERIVNEGGGYSDWKQAINFAKLVTTQREFERRLKEKPTATSFEFSEVSDDNAVFSVWLRLRRTRLFVRKEWDRIVKLGDALLAAPNRTLT
jgi:hypothetical protein